MVATAYKAINLPVQSVTVTWGDALNNGPFADLDMMIAGIVTKTLTTGALALTATHNLKNGLIDDVIPEPLGGAHRHPKEMAERIQHYVVDWVRELQRIDPETLVRKRFEKFRSIGSVK